MKSDRAVRRVLAAVFPLALIFGACGGTTANPSETEPGSSEVAPSVSAPGWPVVVTDDGRVVVQVPEGVTADFLSLVPADWPTDAGDTPTLAVGAAAQTTEGLELEMWALVQSGGLEAMRGVPVDSVDAIRNTKLIGVVERFSDGFVTLDRGEAVGVTPGDFYYVLNAAPDGEVRMGARVGALLTVTETAEKSAIARVVHARDDVTPGDTVVFAQASFELPTRNATVLIAPFEETSGPGATFPAIAEAMPEYLARFNLTNIGVEVADAFIDPRPYDAADTARDLARGDYGAMVFGVVEGETLVFNTTAFGDSPHPATTVGILPGGLPIPIGESLAALSEQLSPSFIATVLALRGDHALAAYFLESVLAEQTMDPAVRYHLREHLALRYQSLDRPTEALRIMTHDVDAGRANNDVYPLLNALSIRSHLDSNAGLVDLYVSDTEEFLAVAEGVLPTESLGGEILNYARALLYADRPDDANEAIHAVIDAARAMDDTGLELSALLEMAVAAASDDPATARLVLADASSVSAALSGDEATAIQLFDAELAAASGDNDGALQALAAALDGVADSPTAPLRASVYRRAASVFLSTERQTEAVLALQEAAAIYLETAQLDRASSALIDLAFLKLRQSSGLPPGPAAQLIGEARQNLILGAELALRLGRTLDAARGFMWAGLLELRIGQTDGAEYLLDRAELSALTTAHYGTLSELFTERSSLRNELGDIDSAVRYRELALLFGRANGEEPDLPPLSSDAE